MNKQQEELQFLGFFGIWRESFRIIHQWSGIFVRLGLALTLLPSFIYLAHTEISHLLVQNMALTANTLAISFAEERAYEATLRAFLRELAGCLLFEVAYIAFHFIFSLLSTSTIVYTVVCLYTGKRVNFKDFICVNPRVWKRLMVTLLSVKAIMLLYNFVFGFVIIMIILLACPFDPSNMDNMMKLMLIGLAVFIFYLGGICYMSVNWQLANTISVLEDSYGFQALRKSKALMKGKMGISVAINLCGGTVLHMYDRYVVADQVHGGMISRFGFGITTLFPLCGLFLLELVSLVVHTMLYLVCKSYHHEQIDKTALTDHLEVYHGEGYVLLKPKGIKLTDHHLADHLEVYA